MSPATKTPDGGTEPTVLTSLESEAKLHLPSELLGPTSQVSGFRFFRTFSELLEMSRREMSPATKTPDGGTEPTVLTSLESEAKLHLPSELLGPTSPASGFRFFRTFSELLGLLVLTVMQQTRTLVVV